MELIVIQNTSNMEEDHFGADDADSQRESIWYTKTDGLGL